MKTKQLLSISLLLSLLTACVGSGKYDNLKAQYDSLAYLNRDIEDQFYQTDSLVASVLSTFQEISHIENMINVNRSVGERPRSERERIRNNMQQIYERLDKSQLLIDNLASQLEKNGKENNRLYGTISLLRLQIEKQRLYANNYEQELESRSTALQVLDSRIRSLRQEATRLRRDQELFSELLDARERKQNEVRYCIGTEQDLIEMGLLNQDKELTIKEPQIDYLTTESQMSFRSLEIASKKAKLLSVHPTNTYTLTNNGKQMQLEILDPEGFWSYTRLMVIKVH